MATFTGQAAINNSFTGTAAADLFRWRATDLNNLDRAVGAGGVDALQLVTGGGLAVDALAGVSGIERFVLARAGSGITLANANFAGVIGAKIRVTGGAGDDTVSGVGLSAGNALDITAGAGNDRLTGGAGRDVFRFTEDNLTSADTVIGGAGLDRLVLVGTGAVVPTGLNGMSGVETIQLSSGGNGITLVGGTFANVAGGRITVLGGAGNDTVDGSALAATNRINVTAGAGADVLRGGAGRDVFRFRASDLNGDTVQGGAGIDTVLLTSVGPAGFNGVSGVETIRLSSAGNGITLISANFANVTGAKIVVIGGAGNDSVRAIGLSSTNAVDITAGGGTDKLDGSAGADVFRFRATDLTGADTVTGGAGRDTLVLTTAGTITQTQLAGVTEVETI